MEPNIAVFGTGRMGYPLVQRLLELGYQVTAYNRTIDKAALLVQDGAKIAASPGEAAAESQLLLMMVSNADVVHALLDEMGEHGKQTGKTMIVMSTISSEESERLRDRMISSGGSYLEAPVMGGPADVRKGRLTIMVGAEEHDYKTWEKFLGGLARNLVWTGPIGSACVVKISLELIYGGSGNGLSDERCACPCRGYTSRNINGHPKGVPILCTHVRVEVAAHVVG